MKLTSLGCLLVLYFAAYVAYRHFGPWFIVPAGDSLTGNKGAVVLGYPQSPGERLLYRIFYPCISVEEATYWIQR
jgi:hypothetical protein